MLEFVLAVRSVSARYRASARVSSQHSHGVRDSRIRHHLRRWQSSLICDILVNHIDRHRSVNGQEENNFVAEAGTQRTPKIGSASAFRFPGADQDAVFRLPAKTPTQTRERHGKEHHIIRLSVHLDTTPVRNIADGLYDINLASSPRSFARFIGGIAIAVVVVCGAPVHFSALQPSAANAL
jgi:hypothetical protein